MPRPARRTAAQPRDGGATATPTRQTTTNAITADIPPFLLNTPPHAPFVTTPAPPANNPGQSIVPERNIRRNARAPQQTPTATGAQQPDNSQTSTSIPISDLGHHEDPSFLESAHRDAEDAKQLRGLRDISSLATWTLSSAKPGCALPQLRHPSPNFFWQSDGPQPHTLTLHFFKLVAIVKLRVYLDFDLDESYTPTKMKFYAGMSEGGLVEFGSWQVTEIVDSETGETRSTIEGVRGWIDISLKGVGGREARYHEVADAEAMEQHADLRQDSAEDENQPPGDVLKAMVVQVQVCENHQNGKDTHVRGFQVFSRDETFAGGTQKRSKKGNLSMEEAANREEVVTLQPADWMRDPEIR